MAIRLSFIPVLPRVTQYDSSTCWERYPRDKPHFFSKYSPLENRNIMKRGADNQLTKDDAPDEDEVLLLP